MLFQGEVETANGLASKTSKPKLRIDPVDDIEDEDDAAPKVKIQLYQTHASPLHRPLKSNNTFETLQTKVIRAASNLSGRLLENKSVPQYLSSLADESRKNKTAEKSRQFQ